MKILVVFYSLEGNTKFVAEAIASAVKADTLELKPKKDINSKGFMRYFWGGKQVMMNERPELLPVGKNPVDYDILFIGTPVWSFTYAPALNTFFSTAKPAGKKVAVFCSHSGGMKKTLDNMKEALAGNTILGETDFIDPLKRKGEALAKARKWAKEIAALAHR